MAVKIQVERRRGSWTAGELWHIEARHEQAAFQRFECWTELKKRPTRGARARGDHDRSPFPRRRCAAVKLNSQRRLWHKKPTQNYVRVDRCQIAYLIDPAVSRCATTRLRSTCRRNASSENKITPAVCAAGVKVARGLISATIE